MLALLLHLLLPLALAAEPVDAPAPDPAATWAALAPALDARPAAVTVPTPAARPLRYTLTGLVEDTVLHVTLRPTAPDTLAVTVDERPGWRAALHDGPGGWSATGEDTPLLAGLAGWLAPGDLASRQGWLVQDLPLVEERFERAPPGDPTARINRCSCPVTVAAHRGATARLLAEDGWPLLAVVVEETIETTLAGGAQRWGGERGSWTRVTWLREGAPLSLGGGPERGSWSTWDGPSGF